jgi:choline dehydrogenase
VELIHDNPGVGAQLLDHPGVAFFMLPKWGYTNRHAPLIQTVCRYQSEGSTQTNDMILQPGNLVPFPRFNSPMVSLMAAMGKPRGVGRIYWESADSFAKPVIVQNFLEEPSDRARAIEAIERNFELAETPPMKSLVRHLWPGRKILRDRDRMNAWIRKSCDSGYHPCGTVPMGTDDNPKAATDSRGRVRGLTGLIVADASLMPTIPSSNIHLPTLMIGERFGEWLRESPDLA